MATKQQPGRNRTAGSNHCLHRALRCESLESRVFPGSLLLSAMAAGAGAGVRTGVPGADELQSVPNHQQDNFESLRETVPYRGNSLHSLLDGLEQSRSIPFQSRPGSQENHAADDSLIFPQGEQGLLASPFRSLLGFEFNVGLNPWDSLFADAPLRDLSVSPSGLHADSYVSSPAGGTVGPTGTSAMPEPAAGGTGRSGSIRRATTAAASSLPAASATASDNAPLLNASPVDSPQPSTADTSSPEIAAAATDDLTLKETTANLLPMTEASLESLPSTLPGDFTGDGAVNGGDFLAWQRNIGKQTAAQSSEGDADRDGDVDRFDLASWQSGFGVTQEQFAAERYLAAANSAISTGLDSDCLASWQSNFAATSAASFELGDADRDGDVDGNDFLHWQRGVNSPSPEPLRVLEPVATRDDGDWGYIERGLWQTGTGEDGWQEDHRVQTPGDGSQSAEWVTILPAGRYEVFATWVPADTNASDASYQILDGATQLGTVSRDQTRTPQDGSFNGRTWESLGTYDITTGVPTVRLTSNTSGNVVADGVLFVSAEDCEFDTDLTGWRVLEDGGSPTGHGGVASIDCAAILYEGDSFRTSLEQSFIVPAGASQLSFQYDMLQFDTSDPDFINDAFEVALIDQTGASLVPTYTGDFTRDAFFNVSEDLPIVLGEGVTHDNGIVTVSLEGVSAGTEAALLFRLASDDLDTGTSVRILDVTLPGGAEIVTADVAAKFFVVDATADSVFRYSDSGADNGSFVASPLLEDARGIASAADGSRIWTIDGTTRRVQMQGPDGTILGSWRTSGLSAPQGITVHGDDLWVVDSDLDRVLHFAGAAGRMSGEAIPTESFALDVANAAPSDLVTDGSHIWVVDDLAATVFKYELEGTLLGSWALDAANSNPSGITLDPSGTVSDLWVVDRTDQRVYRYASAQSLESGSLAAADDFALNASNINPEGIADPPDDTAPKSIIKFDDFSDTGLLSINGNAQPVESAEGTVLRLVPAATWQSGSAFSSSTVNARDFSSAFSFRITNPGGTNDGAGRGADGIVFVIQSVSSSIGGSGLGIGYSGIQNSVGVEFDTWRNGSLRDPSSNHLGIVTAGNVNHGSGAPHTKNISPRFDNGELWYAWVDYDGQSLEVRVSQNPERPLEATLSRSLDVPDLIQADEAFVGFTSATGTAYGNHDIVSWQYVDTFAPLDEYSISINATTHSHKQESGQVALLSGTAVSATTSDDRRPIVQVAVNGTSADVLDVNGRFFSQQIIQPGINRFEIVASDAEGLTGTTVIEVFGEAADESRVDFSRYADITDSFSSVYGRTSFKDEEDILHVELATRNDGTFATEVPLLVGVKNLRERGSQQATVEVVGADGVTPDGIPYFDFSEFVTDGELAPGEVSGSPVLSFSNPNRVAFDYELVFYSKLNSAPVITSVPDVEALLEKEYSYPVIATDENGDPLSYELLQSPDGMAISPEGAITWTPTVDQAGNHPVTVQVSDGRGGIAEQSFTVSAIVAPPNRPPVITSTPVTEATVSAESTLASFALDPNDNTQIQYTTPNPTSAHWEIREDGSVFQTMNSDPAVFLFNQQISTSSRIQGTIQVTSSLDDDHIGFVFGYQNENQFYTFDWSSVRYNRPFGEMRIRKLDGTATIVGSNVMATDAEGVSTLASKRLSWGFRPYDFVLEQFPGGFQVQIFDGETSLFDETIFDDDFTTGKFGFLNSSQENVLYRGFASAQILSPTYFYDVEATDDDGDTLSYTVADGPEGLKINSLDGRIQWGPTADQVGNHPVVVEVSDGRGGVATQEFVVCVKPDPANHAPIITSDPVTHLNITNIPSNKVGDVTPEQLYLTGDLGDLHCETVAFSPETSIDIVPSADIVFIVDQSISMQNEHVWLHTDPDGPDGPALSMLESVDASLAAAGITDARYGLVGYGAGSVQDTFNIGDGQFGTAQEFVAAATNLALTFGTPEDGYLGIEHVLENYQFRPGASVQLVLVTDEDRNRDTTSERFNELLTALQSKDAVLNVIVNAEFTDNAIGINAEGATILADGQGDYSIGPIGEVVGASGATEAEYTDLAERVSGSIWNITQLSSEAEVVQSFTKAFVDILTQSVEEELLVDVVSLDSRLEVSNLTGPISLSARRPSASFDVEIVNPGAPDRFNLAIVKAGSSEVLGLVSVFVNSDYRYHVDAIDPNEDTLTFSLLASPEGMTIDPSTGLIQWEPSPDQLPSNKPAQIFFAEDVNTTDNPATTADDPIRPDSLPNSQAAFEEFVAQIRDPRVESFESFADGEAPSELSFGSDKASLVGSPTVREVPADRLPPRNTLDGAYPTEGQKQLFHFGPSGSFQIEFSGPQSAFGFFATDVGDGGAQLIVTLHYEDATTLEHVLDHSTGNNTGSALFFGIVDRAKPFTKAIFQNTNSTSDGFGFDQMVIAGPEDIVPDSVPVTVQVTDGRGGTDEQSFSIILSSGDGEIRGRKFTLMDSGLIAQSTFETSLEGWEAVQSPEETNWESNGGNPDGFLRYLQIPLNGPASVRAPEEFLGDWSQLEGGATLEFDQKVITPGPALSNTLPRQVEISGPGGTAVWESEAEVVAAPSEWESIQIPIDEPHWNVVSGTWDALIAAIDKLQIRVELFGNSVGSDSSGLDNIRLLGPQKKPLPDWTIYLDQNNNGRRDTGEKWTLTDQNGEYAFIGLPEGTYIVREEQQAGWVQTFPIAGNGQNSSDVLYAIGNGVGDASSNLYVIQNFSASPSAIDLGESGVILLDLAINPLTNKALGTDGNNLYEIDLSSAQVSPIGAMGVNSQNALAFDSTGQLFSWGYDDTTLYGVDTNTGIATPVLDTGFTSGGDLVVDADGIVFGSTGTELISIDLENDLVSTRGTFGVDGIFGLEIDRAGNLYAGRGSDDTGIAEIYSVDSQNGHATLVSSITDSDSLGHYGMSFLKSSLNVSLIPGAHIVPLLSGQVVGDRDFANSQVASTLNGNPFFTTAPSLSTAYGELFRYDAQAADPENNTLTFSLVTGPAGMTINPQTGTLVWQPRESQLGEHEISLRVDDAQGGADIQPFTLTVVAPNTAPAFTSTPQLRAVQDRPYVYNIGLQDADHDLVEVTIAEGSVGTLFPTAVFGPNGETLQTQYRFEWNPNADDVTAGNREITLMANDGRGVTEQTFTVQVVDSATNTAPEIQSNPRTVAYPGLPYVYPVLAEDIDGDPLSYSRTLNPGGMEISPEGVITWTPLGNATGIVPVEVLVSDGQGGEAPQQFEIRIATQDENTAPRITSNPPQHIRHGKDYAYNPVATDAEGDPLQWALTAAPIGMSIDSATGAIRWTPREDQIGTHSIELSVTDPFGATHRQSFAIEVACTNTPPLILSAPVTQAAVGEPYFYGVRGSDANGDPLTYSLVDGPEMMTIRPTGLILWTPEAADEGQTRSVVIRVDDGDGGFVIQEYNIEVTASIGLNRAPVITTTPVYSVTIGDLYEYFAEATDLDGDDLTWSLTTKPDWLDVEPETGRLFGSPTTEGIDSIVLQVTDGTSIATQGFAINVRENAAPRITSDAKTAATAGETYRYSVRAIDDDGDLVTYAISGPTGMTIDGFGRILWDVPVDFAVTETVNVPVSVSVSDPRGASAEQSFDITVSPDTQAPIVSLEVRVGGEVIALTDSLDLGATATVRVTAFDNVEVDRLALDVDGNMIALDASGQAIIQASSLAAISLAGKALDTAGNEGTASRSIQVVDPADRNRPVDPGRTDTPVVTEPGLPPHPGFFDPADNGEPIVTITSPELDSTVLDFTPIIGTIDDPEDNLWYWRAYIARLDQIQLDRIDLDDPDLKLIAEGTEEVHEAEIATFDPTLLHNDAYAIVVAAYDINGKGYVRPTTVNVEGNIKLGEFRLEFTDLTIPLAGIPIEVSRVYDTRDAASKGDFGYGWSLGVQNGRILETVPPGPGDGLFSTGMPFVPGKTKVYITNPSGQRVGFTYDLELQSAGFFGATYKPVFKPDPGVYDTLEAPGTVTAGLFGFFDFNPSEYTLTTRDGLKYRYTQNGGLQSITDRNANVITYAEDGITHSSGEKITFVRDGQNRIKQIIAPDGSLIDYKYNADGELELVTSQTDTTTAYTYLDSPNHYLDEAFDARGERAFKVTYDADGRYDAIIDALGNTIQQQQYDELADHRATVLDANGNPTELLYDQRGNIIEGTDAEGNTTYREYNDPTNPDLETRIIDRDGIVTERQYDTRGNVKKILELGPQAAPFAEPLVTEFNYNSRNDVTSIRNANGAATVFAYDGRGNLKEITNAENNKSSFTYDSLGRRKTFTDFNGHTTTFEYAGTYSQPRRVIAADDTYQQFGYNQFGQVTLQEYYEADGTLVERLETHYDRSGRVTHEISGLPGDPNHPHTEVRKFYDGELLDWEVIVNPLSLNGSGELLESPDTPVDQRLSRITDFEYDAAGNLVSQVDAEGGVVEFRYDAAGNRILLQDPVGNITTWLYDSQNRVSEERDPFYNEGLSIAQALAALEIPSRGNADTDTPADHATLFDYTPEGTLREEIDRNGRRREFDYDPAGRLTEERWYAAADHPLTPGALVETISFTYDAVGNMETATDSNSDYLFKYDTLNRLQSVDNNPNGTRDVPHVVLTYGYDAQGNVTLTQDNWGVTVDSTYDKQNRLETRKWYDADVPAEETADVADARVDFFYNAAGRESEVFRYSDLDSATLVGRTERTYDQAGRSDLLTHYNALDELLAGYDYDYDFAGLLEHESRSHQDAAYAQEIDYRYDLTGQLTDALFEKQDDEHYEYDANGNRLFSRVGSSEQTYTPDTANQLESDGIYRYEYDGEGNQIKRIDLESGETRTFEYDHGNRLVKVDDWSKDPGDPRVPDAGVILTQTVEYSYDTLDRRISRSADTDGFGAQESEKAFFVYDRENVWIDFNSADLPEARYVFGSRIDQIIASIDVAGEKWYLTDRLGTIRSITDSLGQVLNHNQYSAFGILLSQSDLVASRYGFTGREYDANIGLNYYRARVFDPILGSFRSQDPLGFEAMDTNFYRYARNSPLMFTDPTGQLSVASATIATSIVFGGLQAYFSCGQPNDLVECGGQVLAGAAIGGLVGAGIVILVSGSAAFASAASASAVVELEIAIAQGITQGLIGTFGAIVLDKINQDAGFRERLPDFDADVVKFLTGVLISLGVTL